MEVSPHPPPGEATHSVQLETHSVQFVTQSNSLARIKLLMALLLLRCRQILPRPKFLANRIKPVSSGKYPNKDPPFEWMVFIHNPLFFMYVFGIVSPENGTGKPILQSSGPYDRETVKGT